MSEEHNHTVQKNFKFLPRQRHLSKEENGEVEEMIRVNANKKLLQDPLMEKAGKTVYGDLVYKFKKIVGRADFSDQFRKIIVRYKRIGYNINIMRQSACLVFNPITVNNFASLFNCTPVGRASDSMMAPT